MNRSDRIKAAEAYLERHGYVIAENPTRGVDIVAFHPSNPKQAVFIAVIPVKGTFIPMQPFKSKAGNLRFVSIKSGAARWMKIHKWTDAYRIDTVAVREQDGVVDHIENAAFETIFYGEAHGKKENTKADYIVKWKPVDGGKESSYLTPNMDEAIENFKANVRLGHRVSIEVMR